MKQDMVQVRRGKSKNYQGPEARIGRSQFNRSHGLKTTFDASYLYPFLLDEVLPGDTVTCSLDGYIRIFSPLDAPVMDNLVWESFFFFVPTRLVWEHWVDMNGEHFGIGAQDTDYTIPIMDTGIVVDHDEAKTVHGLAAHLGLPHGLDSNLVEVSAIPFRCYNFIINEWFRDQNLEAGWSEVKDDGPDTPANYSIIVSHKKHDYFSSALPYTQKGDPITIPIGGTAPVSGLGTAVGATISSGAGITPKDSIQVYGTGAWSDILSSGAESVFVRMIGAGANDLADVYADLTLATGVSVNALRESVSIQRLLERDARGGTQYVEHIKAHFGVTSPDYRLQRPEYLGGGKAMINISPVANTSDTAGADQGELRGIGTGVVNGHSWAKSFTEHGYIMGIMRARGDLSYFQGIDKLWTRSSRYDFFVPALANLGEQSVLNKELFVSNNSAIDDATFAFQERWAEYRTKMSRVSGKMNPDVTGSLSHWHLAEDFGTLPSLNVVFMHDATPMARITTVDDEPDFLMDLWFTYKWARPMPVYSIPSLVARF